MSEKLFVAVVPAERCYLHVGDFFLHPEFPGRIFRVTAVGEPREEEGRGSVRDVTMTEEINFGSEEFAQQARELFARHLKIEATASSEVWDALVPDELKPLRPMVITFPIDLPGAERLSKTKPGDVIKRMLVIGVNEPRIKGRRRVLDLIVVPLPEGKPQ